MIGLNNYFNIRKGSKWVGSIGSTRGFVDFEHAEYCVRAAWIIIAMTYRRKGILSIAEIIDTYAPPSENDTDKYITFVCSHMSCFPFDICNSIHDYVMLLHYISWFEVGKENALSADFIFNVVIKFKLEPYKLKK